VSDASAAVDAPSLASDAVVVRLGAGRFAADLACVAEVGRVPALTRVPGMPSWLAGVANWRGRVLPVLDLRSLLGAPTVSLEPHARLLVLTAGGVTAGLLVERVDGTASLSDVTDAFPPVLAASAAELLAGQVPQPDGPIAVLDIAAVIRLRDQLPRGRRSA
jgi:purine-binding chemotaxis protein CheW